MDLQYMSWLVWYSVVWGGVCGFWRWYYLFGLENMEYGKRMVKSLDRRQMYCSVQCTRGYGNAFDVL